MNDPQSGDAQYGSVKLNDLGLVVGADVAGRIAPDRQLDISGLSNEAFLSGVMNQSDIRNSMRQADFNLQNIDARPTGAAQNTR